MAEINYPVIPETITVHLGPPGSEAKNVTVPFADYVKNAEWEIRKSHLAEGPGTEIAMEIESKTALVLSYDFYRDSDDNVIYDQSGNGYDAVITGNSATDGYLKFDGDTLVETPLKTLSYPYTVSFDVKLSAADGAANWQRKRW